MTFSSNNPLPISTLRQPRGFVSINGTQVPWERFEVSNTRYSAAGTFKVMIPASTLPSGVQLADLVKNSPLTVQINAGISLQTNPQNASPSNLPMLIQGDTDDFVFDPLKTMITISGRDYSALFLDNKVQNNSNVINGLPTSIVSSEIVSKIASARGITPVVTETQNPIGKYFQNQYSKISTQITEWDLMTYLAREENYDIYLIGKKLYFQPKQTQTPYIITLTVPYYSTPGQIPTSNVIDISFTRNFKLAKNIIVKVSSWNVTDDITYTATQTLNHTFSSSDGPPQIYSYTFPNLKQEQCQLKAQNILQQISQHEMKINVVMPADEIVTAHSVLSCSSTSSMFDQVYYVKNVTREMDFGGAYIMHIEAKNNSPYSVT